MVFRRITPSHKSLKNRVSDAFQVSHYYKKEFKKQMRLLIIVTIGFTIAFVWREVIFTFFQAILAHFYQAESALSSQALTATFMTILGIIIILITSKYLQDKPYL